MTLRYAHVSDRETEAAAERIGRAIAALMSEPTHRECKERRPGTHAAAPRPAESPGESGEEAPADGGDAERGDRFWTRPAQLP